MPARYDFTVDKGSEHGAVRDIDVTKVHELTIRLERTPAATISGRVTGIDVMTKPVSIIVTGVAGDSQSGGADDAGNFRITDAPAGVVDVYAVSIGGTRGRSTKHVSIDAAPNAENRVDLAFAPQIAIQGRVTRGATPISGASSCARAL